MRAISKETLTLSFAIKELRSGVGGLWVFMFCLALGVAALTAIGSLRESIHAGMHAQSAEVYVHRNGIYEQLNYKIDKS